DREIYRHRIVVHDRAGRGSGAQRDITVLSIQVGQSGRKGFVRLIGGVAKEDDVARNTGLESGNDDVDGRLAEKVGTRRRGAVGGVELQVNVAIGWFAQADGEREILGADVAFRGRRIADGDHGAIVVDDVEEVILRVPELDAAGRRDDLDRAVL